MDQENFISIRKEYYTYKKDTFYKKVKESVFGIIYVLLKEKTEEGGILDPILEFSEFAEFMEFPFHQNVKSIWFNDKITDYMYNYLEYLSIVKYFEGRPNYIYLTGYYISLLSITMILFNIAYVSYSFNRKYFTVTWPLYILKTVAKVFLTALFNPLLELTLSIFVCEKNDNGDYYLEVNKKIKCYDPAYFIHMSLGTIITICFMIICLFVALTLFENSEKNGGESAKENSRADFINLCSKTFSTTICCFVENRNYHWLIIAIHFSCSTFQLLKLYIDKPYYNMKQQRLLLIYNSIYMWANVMLVVCKIFERYKFKGFFYIWLIGVPIVCFIIYNFSNDTVRVLSKDIIFCKNAEEVQRHLKYLLTISDSYNKKDKEFETQLINKYISNHNCQDIACSLCELKQKYKKDISNVPVKTIEKLLYNYIANTYSKEISKYPNNTSLRIAYSMFLFERKNDKALAYQQFDFAEKYSPAFDEEFIIYRYKRMIKDENEILYSSKINKSDEENLEEEELDVVSSIVYDSHFRLCLYNIKKSTELYINFWEKIVNGGGGQDLAILNEIALNINSANKNIVIHWKNMCEIKPNDPKTFKMYGEYVKYVLNNIDRGNELLTIGYEKSDKKPNNIGYLNFEIDEEYILLSKEGNAFIICSNEDETFGNIIKCSKTTTKFVGFTDKEILNNENIKNVFVECYNKYILNFIKSELYKKRNVNRTFLMFVRHKSNKPKAINVLFKRYNGKYLNSKCFVCIFLYDTENRECLKKFTKISYFVVDQDFKIKYLTQEAVEFVNNLGRKIPDDYGNFYNILPEFEFDVHQNNYSYLETNNNNNNNNDNDNNNNNENYDNNNNEILWNENFSIQSQKQYVAFNDEIGCKAEIKSLECYKSDENKLFVIKITIMNSDRSNHKKNDNKYKDKCINIKPVYFYPKLSLLKKKLNDYNESEEEENIDEESDNIIDSHINKNNKTKNNTKNNIRKNNNNKNDNNNSNEEVEINDDEIKVKIMNTNNKDNNDNNSEKIINIYEIVNNEKPINFNYFRNLIDNDDDYENNNNNEEEEEDETDEEFKKKKNNNSSNDFLKNSDDISDEIKDDVLSLTKNFKNESEFLLRNRNLYIDLTSEEFKKKLEGIENFGKNVKYFYIIKTDKNELEKVENFIPKLTELIKDKKNALTIKDSFLSLNELTESSSSNFTQKNKVYSTVQLLAYISVFILSIIIVSPIIQFYFNNKNISKKLTHFDIINISFDAMQYFQLCEFFIRKIILSNNEKYNYTAEFDNPLDYVNFNLLKLNEYIEYLDLIHQNITLKSTNLLKSQSNLFKSRIVPFITQFNDDHILDKVNYTFLHSFRLQINLLLSIIPLNISNITYDNDYVYEYLNNNLNDFLINQIHIVHKFHEIINDNVKKEIVIDSLIVFIIILITIACVFYIFHLINFIEIERTKVLKSFYLIPKYYLKKLLERAKNFIYKIDRFAGNSEFYENTNLNTLNTHQTSEGSNNINNFDEENDFLNANSNVIKSSQNNKKKIMNDNINTTSHLIENNSHTKGNVYLRNTILGILFIIIYYSISLSTNILNILNIKKLNINFYLNSFDYVNATIIFNILIEKFINNNLTIFNRIDFNIINDTYDNYAKIHTLISESDNGCYRIFSNNLIETHDLLYFGDICNIKEINDQISYCSSKLNYISNFGGKIMIADFYEKIKKVLDNVYEFIDEDDFDNKIEILNDDNHYSLNILIYDFLRVYLNFYKINLYDFIIDYLKKQKNLNVIILVIYEIVIVVVYIAFWIPFLLSLTDSIFQTQMMIDVIPEEIISKMNLS